MRYGQTVPLRISNGDPVDHQLFGNTWGFLRLAGCAGYTSAPQMTVVSHTARALVAHKHWSPMRCRDASSSQTKTTVLLRAALLQQTKKAMHTHTHTHTRVVSCVPIAPPYSTPLPVGVAQEGGAGGQAILGLWEIATRASWVRCPSGTPGPHSPCDPHSPAQEADGLMGHGKGVHPLVFWGGGGGMVGVWGRTARCWRGQSDGAPCIVTALHTATVSAGCVSSIGGVQPRAHGPSGRWMGRGDAATMRIHVGGVAPARPQ